MKRIVCAAAATIATLLGSSVTAGGYLNPEVNTSWVGSKAGSTNLDLHIGYKDGPWYIQGGPALVNDTAETEWGLTGKAGLSGAITPNADLYAEIGGGKFDNVDFSSYLKVGSVIGF